MKLSPTVKNILYDIVYMWNLKKTSECNRTEIDSTDTQNNLIVIRARQGKGMERYNLLCVK